MTAPRVDRAIEWPFSRARVTALAVTALAMAMMIVPELGYVPLWDGRVYANCVLEAAYSGITAESLRCAGHPSQAWTLTLVVAQLFVPGSVAGLHLTNLALGIGAIAAFRVVLARAFPDAGLARELDLVAFACAVHPVVISTLLQPNVDFGVYVFFLLALAGLFSPSRGGTIVALVGGTLLVFSKETGVPAYAAAVLAALGAEHVRAGLPFRERARTVVRRAAILALPIGLFVAHVAYWTATRQQNAIWKHGWQENASDGFRFFDLSDPVILSYAAGLGVLGFMWVAWLPVACDGIAGLWRIARRRAPRAVTGSDPAVLGALIVMTLALTYLLTSFRTWSNLRYFALLYPLFLVLTYASLHRLGLGAVARRAALAVLATLFVIASYRSVDPLSRVVYGTFDAGSRQMYRMSSITGEFEGPGRDQLVYNLEFTGYHHVQNALFASLRPGPTTVIATSRNVRWNIWSQLHTGTLERSMRRDSVFSPVYADEIDVSARRSPEAWLLEFSNRGYADRSLEILQQRYRVVDSLVVMSHGQRLVARHLVAREAAMLP